LHPPQLIHAIPALLAVVQLRVALSTDQLEVVPIEDDVWVGDVLRSDVNPVVNDVTRLIDPGSQTDLTQTADALGIGRTAVLPCLGFVESLGVLFHGSSSLFHAATPHPALLKMLRMIP
jgi:hypothetical protein